MQKRSGQKEVEQRKRGKKEAIAQVQHWSTDGQIPQPIKLGETFDKDMQRPLPADMLSQGPANL